MTDNKWVQQLDLKENEHIINVQKIVDFLTKINTYYAYDVFMQYVHPEKTIRNQSKQLGDALEKITNEIETNKNIFQLIDGLDIHSSENDLNRMYEYIVRDMRRSGCALSDNDNLRIKQINDKITILSSAFNQNMVNSRVFVELDGDEVLALQKFCDKYDLIIPESNCLELKGYGLYFKILDYCDVESVRRKAYIAFNTGARENLLILKQLQELRAENAKLMGFKNHADFKLEINAIGSADKALAFLEKFRTEMNSVLPRDQQAVSKALGINIDDFMVAYNNSYYLENYRIQEYNVDSTFYRDYFEINHVLEQMLLIYEKFFNVKFKYDKCTESISEDRNLFSNLSPDIGQQRLEINNIWHPDVKLLRVETTERILGKVYLDLYARDGKWSHPSHFGLIHRHQYLDGKIHNVTSVLVMSITKGENNKPTLLTHDEVVTMFHEFGHAMHQLLNESKLAPLGGTSVTRDLVEVPSMFLEYLCWNPDNLRQIGCHWQTKETIPDDKLHSLIAAKHVCASIHYLKQLAYGLFDLGFHTGKLNVDDYNNYITEVCKITRPAGTFGITKFNHLVGYDGRYYTYMFSESYASQINHLLQKNKNHAKYLDFLRYSTQERLERNFGTNSPVHLINEIN
jgi:Zn-dependent oligopeptidase